jgi:hypothetical protein
MLRFACRSAALLAVAALTFYGQSAAPTVAPGLTISGGAIWAVDRFDGKTELVPMHHSTVEVNNHTGSNVAGALAGSFFYHPKMTTELPGVYARTVLHAMRPAIYIHVGQDSDSGNQDDKSDTMTLALVHATVKNDHRIFAKVQFTSLTGHAKRADGIVETTTENLPGGWLKLMPDAALDVGEYAITPIMKTQNTFAAVVYDFSLAPNAPNAPDAVQAKP